MAKDCKIYYGVVVGPDTTWARKGSVSIEPIKVEGRVPIGKDPEFCCTELENEVKQFRISFYFRLGEETGFQLDRSPGKTINFCPYCGDKIIFKEHLKLKVIETPITRHSYHYEVV